MPRSQSTQIKSIMYPEIKKSGKNFHAQNMKNLKEQQVVNRAKKEEKENFVPGIYFNLNQLAELEKIEGVGKSIATKIVELFDTGSMAELDEFLQKTLLKTGMMPI